MYEIRFSADFNYIMTNIMTKNGKGKNAQSKVYRCLHSISLEYLSEPSVPPTSRPSRYSQRFASINQLVVHSVKLSTHEVVSSAVWNSLQDYRRVALDV